MCGVRDRRGMTGLRTNRLFRTMFGDAFPSTSELALNLCDRGGVESTSQVIHLGSGMGSVSTQIARQNGCMVTGVEPQSVLHQTAHSDYAGDSLEFLCAPLDSSPLPDAWGTHILTESRLTMTKEPECLLAEIRRLLSDTGTLMNSEILVTDVSSLDERVKRFLDLLHGQDADLTLDGWRSLLEDGGFDVLEAREEPQIMRSNTTKLNRAMMGVRLLRSTGRLSLSDYGLAEFEEDFDEWSVATLKALDDGIISYASFISKRSL